jgi:hypothetical protein
MTKRAGKRQNRMGSQRHPPGKQAAPDTEERLPEAEARQLEVRAIREGWLITNDPAFQTVRQNLIRKLVSDAATSKDPLVTATIARTLAMMEQRERALDIAELRATRIAELPQQIEVQDERTERADPKQVAVELLQMAEIQQAIDFSPKPPPRIAGTTDGRSNLDRSSLPPTPIADLAGRSE